MDLVLFEDNLKYDAWLKYILTFSVLLLLVLGLIFYTKADSQSHLTREAVEGFKIGALTLFASAAFVLLVYWAVLPRKVFICDDRVKIKYGIFYWNIPFKDIESAGIAKGFPMRNTGGSVTSLKTQVEIVRKGKVNFRISPSRRDIFLDRLNRALPDWKRTHNMTEITQE